MKNPRKSIMLVLAAFGIAAVVLLGFLYITRYKTSDVDTARSENGKYEAVLQAVGEPGWPFGSAPGRLILKEEGETISKTDIEIANDGGPVSEKNWRVIWGEDHVEIILSGGEQYDELVTMYYDGGVESRQLTTYYGREIDSVSGNAAEGTWDNTDGTIVDIYAYVYESGDVVSSGKTQWEDAGSDAYREVTGEE